jgi:hypothetical protein
MDSGYLGPKTATYGIYSSQGDTPVILYCNMTMTSSISIMRQQQHVEYKHLYAIDL